MKHGLILSVHQFPFLSRPLGVHRIAHYLREQNWDIEVIDWANHWPLEKLQELFRSRYTTDTVFVGFGQLFSMWPQIMEDFGQWIKTNYPTVTLISGSGVNPAFTSRCIDYYIQGYGEYAMVELLAYISGSGPRPVFNLNIPGGRKVISAIHNYPAFPMRDLTVRYEDRDFIESTDWLTMEFSRGCMFECDFCNMPALGVKDDHTRAVDNFKEQMRDTYDRFGVKNYVVADETFNDSTEKIIKYADAVEELDFTPWFSGYIRADLLTTRPADKEHLLRMNFLGQYYGIESFNYKSAKIVGKGLKTERLQQGLIAARQYFETHNRELYRGTCSFIVGLPHETRETLENTFSWLTNNWQGQCFNIHKLSIAANDNINLQSGISSNMGKYGYSPMTNEEIAFHEAHRLPTDPQPFGTFDPEFPSKCTITEVLWKNEHMNWYTAQEILNGIFARKKKLDFRPSCYGLSYKLTDTVAVEDKLKLGFEDFDAQRNWSIDNYINKKLNYK
jgi:radical SAM superfamily enzyme YgiQ (UPF0313 family)